jgi:hypothetical protein
MILSFERAISFCVHFEMVIYLLSLTHIVCVYMLPKVQFQYAHFCFFSFSFCIRGFMKMQIHILFPLDFNHKIDFFLSLSNSPTVARTVTICFVNIYSFKFFAIFFQTMQPIIYLEKLVLSLYNTHIHSISETSLPFSHINRTLMEISCNILTRTLCRDANIIQFIIQD